MRNTPICPLTIPSVLVQSPEGHGGMTTQRWPCLGSECARWVQDCHTGMPLWTLDDEGNPETDAARQPIPRGRCSDNMRAVPWPDPAAERQEC